MKWIDIGILLLCEGYSLVVIIRTKQRKKKKQCHCGCDACHGCMVTTKFWQKNKNHE